MLRRREVLLASHGGAAAVDGLLGLLDGDERRWLSLFRRMGVAGRAAVVDLAGTEAGRTPLGRGSGGDTTILLDRVTENAILAILSREAPAPYLAVSEESGQVGDLDARWRLLIDPVDGSLNAKRGLDPFSLAVAASRGERIADVSLGYIMDYTSGHDYAAAAGQGFVSSRSVSGPPDDRIELILLESGRPESRHFDYADLAAVGGGAGEGVRVRQVGSLALCLCYVALGIADVLLAPVPSRAVDIAAGLLMVEESGGGARALDGTDLRSQPLDLQRRAPFIAWRAGLGSARLLSWGRRLTSD
jgi:myo-inositol-1(or 4)-monophosphatase